MRGRRDKQTSAPSRCARTAAAAQGRDPCNASCKSAEHSTDTQSSQSGRRTLHSVSSGRLLRRIPPPHGINNTARTEIVPPCKATEAHRGCVQISETRRKSKKVPRRSSQG